MFKPKIYMAGKVYFGCWRHELVKDLRGALEYDEEGYKEIPQIEEEEFIYTGPFFMSCDHGCYHGENSHGMGLYNIDSKIEYKPDGMSYYPGEGGFSVKENPRQITQEKCITGIKNCDILFAWLDSEDSFGTFAEIGYAKALGKEIWIAYPHYNQDMWFLYMMANGTLQNSCPKCAFRKMLEGERSYIPLQFST